MYSSPSDRIQSVFDEIEFSESWDHVAFADIKIWLSQSWLWDQWELQRTSKRRFVKYLVYRFGLSIRWISIKMRLEFV